MDRVFQDNEGHIPFVTGKTVERLICVMVYYPERDEAYPCVFWLKMAEEAHWNRFSVDDICVYWEIYPSIEQDDLEDPKHFPACETGEQLGLLGLTITHAEAQHTSWESKPANALHMMFSSGQEFILRANEDHAEMKILWPSQTGAGSGR